MSIPLLIVVVSIIVWFFPPFANKRSQYLFFFIILAVSDPIMLLFYYTLKVNPNNLFAASALLLLSSLITKKNIRNILIAASVPLALFFTSGNFSRSITVGSFCLIHVAIIYVLIDIFIRYLSENRAVNLFLTLLITYELITILKIVAAMLSYEGGAVSYYLASFIQIFFGILFSFINIDTKNFSLALTENSDS